MSIDETRQATLTGGCQCGAVRYAFYAEPTKVGICHCRMCQKALGAPFGVFVAASVSDFAWTRGRPASFASSNRGLRHFCANCGTPLGFRPTDGTVMEMMGGTLDDPSLAPPTYEVGREGKAAWIAHLATMTSRTTIENMDAERAATVTSFQHPDRDER